jgi:hypothetical protein
MSRWIAAGCWVLASAGIGLGACLPLLFAFTLAVTIAHGPHPATANHLYTTVGGRSTPVEIDGDETGIVALGVCFAAAVLGALFAGVNLLVRRWLPDRLRPAQWYLAAALLLAPYLVVMNLWWTGS